MTDDNATNRVELSPSGKSFVAIPESSLLESGLSFGVALPYSCANGSCGDCRAKILSGEIRKIRFHDYALTEAEKLEGVCLLCANTAASNLTIEVSEASSARDIPMQTLRGKVCHTEILTDVAIVRFKLTRGKALRYLPGQYARLTTADDESVILPIANCPCEPDYLEFHIPKQPVTGNVESPGLPCKSESNIAPALLLSPLTHSKRVAIEGPFGVFTVEEPRRDIPRSEMPRPEIQGPAPTPVYFIATTTGFATIKPLLEHVMTQENDTPCTLIWIASASISHYQDNLCRSWADAFDNISYKPLTDITEFTESAISEWGLTQVDAAIYISGDSSLNQCVACVLESAGVPATSVITDTTLSDTSL